MVDNATEGQIIQRESGGKPYVGWTGVDLSNAPKDQYGFPIWEGRMGPRGMSHAAGLYQFEPATWREGASALGVKDFSPQSQKQVFDYIHAKYGNQPGAASSGYQEGYGVGSTRHGGTYVGVVHPDQDDGISPEGAALLSSILQSHYPSEDKSTGNGLLDGIMQGHVFGAAEPQQPQALDTRALQAATPPAPSPETVPELQAKPLQTASLQPIQQPALPPPPPPPQVPPQVAAATPSPQAQPRPIIQPDARRAEASILPQGLLDTGNALLDKILSSAPRLTAPRGGASFLGNLLGQPSPVPRAVPSPSTGSAAMDRRHPPDIEPTLAQRAGSALRQDLWDLVTGPFTSGGEQVKQAVETGEMPTAKQAIGDVQPVIGGSIVRPPGSLGAGIGLPGPRGEAGLPVPARTPGAEVGPAATPGPREPLQGAPEPRPAEGGGAAPPPPEPPAGGEMPTAAPIPPPSGVKVETQALSDDLWQASQTGRADMIEAQKLVESLPDELKGAADEQAYHERESRMTGKPTPPSPTTQRIERLLKPFDDAIHATATWIREHAPDIYGQLQEKPLRTAEEGHVHRKVVGQKLPGEMLDPQRGDVITGLGGGLSRRASGMMHRTPDFVLEDNAGNRMPGRGPLVGQKGGPARYGESFTDARTGVRYTVKEPTTAELEAKYANRRYVKSLLANTLDNYLRLSRVRRNIEILEKWKPQLEGAGHWIPEASQANPPRNFVRVDVPQLRGWAEPHIAAELNDIYRLSRDDADGMLQKLNKFLIGTMFSLPYRHILNVGAHYAVGRGFDWVYRNPMLARAYTEVATQGPNYMRYLKAGAGLQYPGPLTENFYNTLLGKLFHDQMTSPEWKNIFDMLGHKAADVVKAEYAWSRKTLWKYNDVFLTARIMELERAGKPLKEAIRTAEQEIPNYRLPTNSTLLRKVINSSYVAFGRYGYGRANALVNTVRNLIGPNATGEERIRAIGQALIMIVGGTEGYKLANAALQTAQQQINQQLGPTWGPRIAGAKPLVVGGIGPFGPLRATAQYIGSMLGLNDDEKGWASVLGSWITPAPAPELAMEAFFNRNTFTGQPVVNPYASPLGRATQFGEAVLGQVNPVQLAIESARKGLLPGTGPQFGFQQEYKGPPGKVRRLLRRQAGRQEARDPIERGIKSLLAR